MTNTTEIIIKSASSNHDVAVLVAKAKELSKKNIVVQLFNPKSITSRTHLLAAYENACVAFGAKENISKNVAMEMLLFAAMTRQIEDAIERVGIKSSGSFVVFSNSKRAYESFGRILEKASDFRPGSGKPGGNDLELLQKMALSRLV